MTEEEYLNDLILQRAVERTLMNLIQATIDLASHIRSGIGKSAAASAKGKIRAIGEAGVISPELQEHLAEAAGFRNVLAHRYGDIDHVEVHSILHEDLRWFERYQQEVAQWLKER